MITLEIVLPPSVHEPSPELDTGSHDHTRDSAEVTGGTEIIIKIYCHIQRALHDELECSLALTHIVPIYTIK